jgi:hypothetical protein
MISKNPQNRGFRVPFKTNGFAIEIKRNSHITPPLDFFYCEYKFNLAAPSNHDRFAQALPALFPRDFTKKKPSIHWALGDGG